MAKKYIFLLAKCLKMYRFLFFDHIHLKFAGSANMTPKISFQQNQLWGIKNADTKIFAMGF